MPPILTKAFAGAKTKQLYDVKYKYRYPRGNNLTPGSPLHDKIRDEILARAQLSREAMQPRYPAWQKLDESLTAYIDLTESEEDLKLKDPNRPVSIVLPVSYATLEILLTYLTAAFLEEPIFRYAGRSDEDEIGAMLLELIISLQTQKSKVGVHLHTIFRDMFVYGFGAGTPVWTQTQGFKRVKKPRGFFSSMLNQFVATGDVSERREVVTYEGNELQAIDPYHFLPDPYTPLHEIQKAEFVGWIRRTNANALIKREKYDRSTFNAQYLKHIDGRSQLGIDESYRDRYNMARGDSISSAALHPVDVIYMYIELIPREMEVDGKRLGDVNYPEKWLFAVAGDSVVISAEPTDFDHNLYPVGIGVCDYDGHSIAPVSRLEMTYGMQHLVNFMINSHVANVRKAINDMFVVDPSLVNIKDMTSPKPGKLIRLRKKVWGRGVKDIVQQLGVTDVTRGHMTDIGIITDFFNKITGAVDPLTGQMQAKAGERRTAEEYRGTRGAALSRLERAAKITSLQLMQDLGLLFASQTQQYMSADAYVKAVGEHEERLLEEYGRSSIAVSPFDIMIDYDLRIHDGTLPNDGDPGLWQVMFQTIAGSEVLMQNFDMVRIFKHWARLAGAKNLSDFVSKGAGVTTVMADEEVEKSKQAGNMISMEEAVASGNY